MKKKNFTIIIILLVMALTACDKIQTTSSVEKKTGTIEFSLKSDDPDVTKAVSAYTTSQDYERLIKSVQVLVFDESGTINLYANLGTRTSQNLSTTVGVKKIWAVVNGPSVSNIQTEAALKAVAVSLDANSKTNGFVMTGSNSCTVGASNATCEVNVKRLLSRVALKTVTNSLPPALGSLTIERVFLANVVGNQNLDGSAAASAWYNKEGRKDETTRVADHIINGSTYIASYPELTFSSPAASVSNGSSHSPAVPYLFYTYANNSTKNPAGFKSTFEAQRSVLTIVATVNGRIQYYPVTLDNAVLERNKTYTVGVEITGMGSDDPNKEVSKSSVSVSVTVAEWYSGGTYDEVL